MATVRTLLPQRLVLHGEPWENYCRLLRIFGGRPNLRITYDRGVLEIMTLSHEHESGAHFLGRLVEALTEELLLPIKGGKSTTFRRRRRRRGLEPDECYWILNAARVRGKKRIDLRMDPPPDLALEVDITHSSLDRLAIYAVLRVPEVWRYNGLALLFYLLGTDGNYAVSSHSLAFPQLTPADLLPFLALQQGQTDENDILRQFRTWVRQQLAGRGGSALPPP